MTVKELVSIFMASRKVVVRPKTLAWYEYTLTPLVTALGDRAVADVRPEDLERFLAGQREGRSDATMRDFHMALRALFNFAEHRGYVKRSPMQFVPRPKRPPTVPVTYSDAEIRALLSAARSQRDRAIVLTLLDTGLRASELLGLEVRDLDLTEGWILVRGGKGGKDRWVPIGDTVMAALRELLSETDHPGSGLVFRGRDGRRLQLGGLRALLLRLKERAGLDCPVYAHKFRHTFAKLYLQRGGDLESLREILGHADVTTTSRHYACFLRDGLKAKHRACSPVDHGRFDQGVLL